MNNLLLFITIVFFYQSQLLSQIPDTMWTKTYGGTDYDVGYSVQQTSDEGYVITGYTASFGAGSKDIWLIKTNSEGDTLWTKTYGEKGNDYGESVQQTFDGGFIVTGWIADSSVWGWENGLLLVKTDDNGNTLWIKNYTGLGNAGKFVQQTTDTGYVITGLWGGSLMLIKADKSGDLEWEKTYGFGMGYSVQQTSEGGYIIAGGSSDVKLIKTNAQGDTLWFKTFGGAFSDWGHSVQQTTDGGYIIAGVTQTNDIPSYDAIVIKTDSSGNALWTKTFGEAEHYEAFRSVQQTSDGEYIVTGAKGNYPNVWLMKLDLFGNKLWEKTIGKSNCWDYGYSVHQTSDGGYIITGYSCADVWLIKTTPDISGIEPYSDLASTNFSLTQNFPNPFNPITTIKYQIPELSFVTLIVYDILGREVKLLVNQEQDAGYYEFNFNASQLSSGVYLYQIKAGDFIQTKKMLLLK